MGYKNYLREFTFVVALMDFFKEAKKKFSDQDIKYWSMRQKRIPELDVLAQKLEINRLDIRNKLVPNFRVKAFV